MLLRPVLICQIVGDLDNKVPVCIHISKEAQENSQMLKKARDKGKEGISVRTFLFRTSQLMRKEWNETRITEREGAASWNGSKSAPWMHHLPCATLTAASIPSHHLWYFPICLRLTSGAGIAQRAADFTLVQMRPWDHQDVGDLAQ